MSQVERSYFSSRDVKYGALSCGPLAVKMDDDREWLHIGFFALFLALLSYVL
jgi:hypothetical protein